MPKFIKLIEVNRGHVAIPVDNILKLTKSLKPDKKTEVTLITLTTSLVKRNENDCIEVWDEFDKVVAKLNKL